MERRDFLKMGMATAGALTLGLGCTSSGLEDTVYQTRQTQESSEDKKLSASGLIKAATLEGSLRFVEKCKKNTPFKEQIKAHGFEETAKHLAEMRSYSVDLADKYSPGSAVIPEREYLAVSMEIGAKQVSFKKTHVKPLHKKVVQARVKTLQIATEMHRKVLSNATGTYGDKDVQDQYHALVKKTFTRDEYTSYCEQISEGMDNYYSQLANSLGWKKAIGLGQINKMKKIMKKDYFETRDKVYGK